MSFWAREFDGDLILPNLYLGSFCKSRDVLKKNNITHILTVSSEFPPNNDDVRDFSYMVIHVEDSPSSNVIEVFDECAQFIDEGRKNGNIFVHCAAGVSRSPTIVAAYLLLRSHFTTTEEAIQFIQQKRGVISPNTGFRRQLKTFQEYEYKLNKYNANKTKKKLHRWNDNALTRASTQLISVNRDFDELRLLTFFGNR